MKKEQEVLIYWYKPSFGPATWLQVWADPGVGRAIERVEGVMKVKTYALTPLKYDVEIDPRYNLEDLMNAIRAEISREKEKEVKDADAKTEEG